MTNSTATDFLIRIKNGYGASRKTITAPSSKFAVNIATLLKKYGYILDFDITGDSKKVLTLSLVTDNDSNIFHGVQIFSKPGRRIYQKSHALPWGKTEKSLIIVSTPSGLMSQKEARKKGLGGEIIAEIY